MVSKDIDAKTVFIILLFLRKSTLIDDKVKKQAIDMYLEGLGFRAIGRVLGISYTSVYYWVKELGFKHQNTYNNTNQNNDPIDIAALDEIHSYTKFKKTTAGLGLLLIGKQNKS